MIPGELLLASDPIALNAGRTTRSIEVVNRGDRPVQVGSHCHFFEVNRCLGFERAAAYGMRLNIAAGTAVRFEPGDTQTVELVALGGSRTVFGLNGLVNGALDALNARFPDLDIIFLESGGDNLAASFSPELVDASIYVIDVSGGDKIPRKGGPGVTRSDLLVINKIDLAPYVGADLGVMERDARAMRGDRPFLFSNLKTGAGVDDVAAWIQRELLCHR